MIDQSSLRDFQKKARVVFPALKRWANFGRPSGTHVPDRRQSSKRLALGKAQSASRKMWVTASSSAAARGYHSKWLARPPRRGFLRFLATFAGVAGPTAAAASADVGALTALIESEIRRLSLSTPSTRVSISWPG